MQILNPLPLKETVRDSSTSSGQLRQEVEKQQKLGANTISGEFSNAAGSKRKKTMKEIDDELQAAMEGRSGDGGLAGAELEGGKAVAMKRGVRENMFRYI